MSPTPAETVPGSEDAEAGAPQARSVLFVCTGNVCRSPAAELLLARALSGTGLAVSSAGTHALVGAPVDGPVAALLDGDGVRTDGFTARQLTEELVERADVVVGLAREHRAAAVRLVPRAVGRAFTLLELARLLGQVTPAALDGLAGPEAAPAGRLGAAVVLARQHRSAVAPGADDVADPYRRSAAVYADAYAGIRQALRPVVAATLGAVDRDR